MVIVSLMLIYIVMGFYQDNANPFNAYIKAQANIGSIYANVMAIIKITYGKTTAKFDSVKGLTYFLGMFGFIMIVLLFAHAVVIVYPDIHIYAEFMRSKTIFVIYNIIFFGIIFAISCTKGINDYTKEDIKEIN